MTLIHEKIKVHREKSGLTQLEVAERLGIAQSSYFNIENGRTELTIRKLVHLAKALGVPSATFGLALTRAEEHRHLARPFVLGRLPPARRRSALTALGY